MALDMNGTAGSRSPCMNLTRSSRVVPPCAIQFLLASDIYYQGISALVLTRSLLRIACGSGPAAQSKTTAAPNLTTLRRLKCIVETGRQQWPGLSGNYVA